MRTLTMALAAAACLALALPAEAQQACGPADPGCCTSAGKCCHCGSCAPCKKVCRIVCEMKKVEITCWDVECEDFCPLLPRLGRDPCSPSASSDCTPEPSCCGSCGPCTSGCPERCIKPPKCGLMRTKKKLVKRTVTREVPVYKCVVECVCCDCRGGEKGGVPTEAEPALPPEAPPPMKAVSSETIPPAPIPASSISAPRLHRGT